MMMPPPVSVLALEEAPSACFFDFRAGCPAEDELELGRTG
jgi:hypothetical protein